MINVSPSKQELEHLKGLVSEKMKEEGMDEIFVNNAEKVDLSVQITFSIVVDIK
jgi:hypothetical protein